MRQSLLLDLHSLVHTVIYVVKKRQIRRQLGVSFPPRRDENCSNLCQRAPHQFLKPILSCARQKHNECNHNSARTYTIPPLPPQVVLYVDKNSHSTKRSYIDEEEEPIEELGHLGSLIWVRIIELIGPKA